MNRMDLLVFIGVVLADIVLLAELLFFICRRSVSNKLIQAAFEGDEEQFEAIRKTVVAKTLNDFDVELIRYNVAEIRRDYDRMDASIRRFSEMDLKDSQKKKIYPKIFYYYIDRNRKQDAKEYYEKLSVFNVYQNKKDIDMTYDAYIKGGHQYLDEALASLKRTSREDLPAREKLIAKMYENKGIQQEAKKYYNLADQHKAKLLKK
ncbi:MAG: hypothetical protein IJU42_07710 [Erysipelotrichaceae bacterium]|nr:hypothetical protein [Erysipelotrichaceae bacterium]